VLPQQSWLQQRLQVVLNGMTCMILVASMLQMVVLLTRHAAAWRFTAALHATPGNAGSAALPQAPSQAHA
jgi:hypothetical protein